MAHLGFAPGWLAVLDCALRLAAGNTWAPCTYNNPPAVWPTSHQTSMKTQSKKKAGFTLVEIMIVVAIIGLLAAIAIPNFVRARTTSQMNACINNLRQIDGAIQQWALENKKDAGANVGYTDISPYLKSQIVCPSGGTVFSDSYTVVNVTTKPVCKKVASTHVLPDITSN